MCKYFKFPVGRPVIHEGEACQDREDMLQKEGLIKSCIIPPQRPQHPGLPYRCNGRLILCLCRSCSIEYNRDGECAHETVEEKALTGTWVIDEVRKAVQKGYEIVEMIEVYEYAVTQYDSLTGEGGLFVEYIDTFLKLKMEAS